jgi:hypothetical protein
MKPFVQRSLGAASSLVVAALFIWWASASSRPGPEPEGPDAGAQHATPPGPAHTHLDRLRARAPLPDGGFPQVSTLLKPGVLAEFGWGSGEGQLGRDLKQEGNPEGPMSLTSDRNGTTWVLDQVNQRLVRVGPHGERLGQAQLTLQAPQDVAVAKDGTAVVMDRLVDKHLALMAPDGTLKGELSLEGKGLPEGGAATGVFTDGTDVYVEREHGDLVKVGNTSGQADAERPELPGRPTRDGTAFISAGIADGPSGQVMVTAIDRATRAHRFTRQYAVGSPVAGLVLLDSDQAGIIFLGALTESETSTPEAPVFAVAIFCLDPVDGRPLGRTGAPANTGPEETFRELTVSDDGTVLYLSRTEQGSQLLRLTCGL